MTTIHHLSYVQSEGRLVRPSGSSLRNTLSTLNLQPGDVVRMQDGQSVAQVVANLTDFDANQPRAFCEAILQHERALVLMRRIRGKLNFVQYIFADRYAMTPDGTPTYQVLSNSFGEPHWVSLDDSYCAFNRSCYEADKLAYHHGSDLIHPVC